jgi:hypothetical protein
MIRREERTFLHPVASTLYASGTPNNATNTHHRGVFHPRA